MLILLSLVILQIIRDKNIQKINLLVKWELKLYIYLQFTCILHLSF